MGKTGWIILVSAILLVIGGLWLANSKSKKKETASANSQTQTQDKPFSAFLGEYTASVLQSIKDKKDTEGKDATGTLAENSTTKSYTSGTSSFFGSNKIGINNYPVSKLVTNSPYATDGTCDCGGNVWAKECCGRK